MGKYLDKLRRKYAAELEAEEASKPKRKSLNDGGAWVNSRGEYISDPHGFGGTPLLAVQDLIAKLEDNQ